MRVECEHLQSQHAPCLMQGLMTTPILHLQKLKLWRVVDAQGPTADGLADLKVCALTLPTAPCCPHALQLVTGLCLLLE